MRETVHSSAASAELADVVAGRPQAIGSFRFWFADQRWEWSDQVATMHGYRPGEVTPSTELLLEHKHPEDRAAVAETLATAVREGQPFCSRHRIRTTTGDERQVLVVADRLHDEGGTVVGTSGYFIDLTDSLDSDHQHYLDDTMPALISARAEIEQAKGVLMFLYSISAEQAFRVLAWRSQETNVKLRDFAAELLARMDVLGGGLPTQRSHFDHLLLTLHEQ